MVKFKIREVDDNLLPTALLPGEPAYNSVTKRMWVGNTDGSITEFMSMGSDNEFIRQLAGKLGKEGGLVNESLIFQKSPVVDNSNNSKIRLIKDSSLPNDNNTITFEEKNTLIDNQDMEGLKWIYKGNTLSYIFSRYQAENMSDVVIQNTGKNNTKNNYLFSEEGSFQLGNDASNPIIKEVGSKVVQISSLNPKLVLDSQNNSAAIIETIDQNFEINKYNKNGTNLTNKHSIIKYIHDSKTLDLSDNKSVILPDGITSGDTTKLSKKDLDLASNSGWIKLFHINLPLDSTAKIDIVTVKSNIYQSDSKFITVDFNGQISCNSTNQVTFEYNYNITSNSPQQIEVKVVETENTSINRKMCVLYKTTSPSVSVLTDATCILNTLDIDPTVGDLAGKLLATKSYTSSNDDSESFSGKITRTYKPSLTTSQWVKLGTFVLNGRSNKTFMEFIIGFGNQAPAVHSLVFNTFQNTITYKLLTRKIQDDISIKVVTNTNDLEVYYKINTNCNEFIVNTTSYLTNLFRYDNQIVSHSVNSGVPITDAPAP